MFVDSRHFACALKLTSTVEPFKVDNEPVLEYRAGSDERRQLEQAISELKNTCTEVPIVVDGKEIKSDLVKYQVAPFEHSHKVARFYWATPVCVSSFCHTICRLVHELEI